MAISGEVHQDRDFEQFRWTLFDPATTDEDDGRDVVAGLSASPKTLPPKYFYDDRGSNLFEQITELPEYYLTRTEEAILAAAASDIVEATGPGEVIELGSGSARKSRLLLDAYARDGAVRYLPVDVSGGILKASSRELIEDYPELEIWGLIGTYEQALAALPPRDLATRMVMFLGSTIGNLNEQEAAAFLERAARALKSGEYFLMGFDLQKPPEIIEAAYNDSAGVTAEFNLNMLRHLNGRFDGDFDLGAFAHEAVYRQDLHQIEMHLRSLSAQSATLADLDLSVSFAEGESVRTEISRKFSMSRMIKAFNAQGFDLVEHWTDPNVWFALALFRLR